MRYAAALVLGIVLSLGTLQAAHATSDITISSPTMVDTTGHQVSSFVVGQEIGVESVLTNHGTGNQKFSYLVQVVDSDGINNYFGATSASLLGSQSFNATQVWIPKAPGTYTVQVYVWDSLASAVPLTDVIEKKVTVS